jgi:predicted ATPase/DNA-binding SARP family transcriptional activator
VTNFRVLGPVEARIDERPLRLCGPQQVKLLAFLLMRANRAVSADAVIDAVWGSGRGGAAKRLQMGVFRLRRSLAPLDREDEPRLRTVSGGYLLSVGSGELDADVFTARWRDGQRALEDGDPALASGLLSDALGLWRGPAFAEVAFEDFAQAEIRQLDELRLVALETRIDADLQVGRCAELIPELEGLVAEQPTRERIVGQLMTALYRSGRQTDALQVYQRTRAQLVEHLGLQPGPVLKTLQQQILDQSLLAQSPGNGGSVGPTVRRASAGSDARPVPVKPRAAGHVRVPLTPTIGRERECEQVASLLRRPGTRLITLTGPGGVGKTRLALTVAHRLAAHHRDGSWWIELAAVERSEDVAPTLARALEVTVIAGESTDEALLRHLGTKRALIVVDNLEHVLASAPLIVALLAACPDVTVLATSRERLNVSGEHIVHVEPLAVPEVSASVSVTEVEATDAGALFVSAARRHDSDFAITPVTAPVIARLCGRLDGLPLALELAAACTGLLGVEQLDAELHTTLRELAAGRRDAAARHQTLEATIEWSYRLLDQKEQDAFVGFAVFAGGATLEAAQFVTGAARATLQALTAKSLLERRHQSGDTTRLVMLETVRHYALGRLSHHPGHDEVYRRHHDHFLSVAEQCVPKLSTHEERDALATLDAEVDNLTAVMRWALEAAPSSALRLAGLLGDYWWVRHDLGGLHWLETALGAAGERAPLEDRARAHLSLATQLSFRHEGQAEKDELKTALGLSHQANDHAGMSKALAALARNAGTVDDDLVRERAYADAACRHARIAGDDRILGHALARLAAVLPPAERTPVLQQVAELLARVGDYTMLATAYNGAAYVALAADRVHEATGLLDTALSAVERGDNPLETMIVHGNLGLAKLFSGDVPAAREAFGCQLRLCAQHAFRHDIGESLAGLAAVAAAEGKHEASANLRGAARAAGYPPTAFDTRIDGRLERDYYAAARACFGQAAWSCAEEAGAALSVEHAIACALAEDRFDPSPEDDPRE